VEGKRVGAFAHAPARQRPPDSTATQSRQSRAPLEHLQATAGNHATARLLGALAQRAPSDAGANQRDASTLQHLMTAPEVRHLQATAGNHATAQLLGTLAQRAPSNAGVIQRNGELEYLMKVSEVRENVLSRLRVKDLVNLSEVAKSFYALANPELYSSHAKKLPYATTASAAKKLDTDEFQQVLSRVQGAVNVGYRMLMEILTGHQPKFAPEKFGITDKRWLDYYSKTTKYAQWQKFLKDKPTKNQKAEYKLLHGKAMHPSTAAGYIVEDIAGHVLKSWYDSKRREKAKENKTKKTRTPLEKHLIDLQDTDIMGGHSRPDMTALTRGHGEQMLFDITSVESKGHIIEKYQPEHPETDWLQYPHVAEVLYPQINFADPNQTTPELSTKDLAAIQLKLLEKQIGNDLKRYSNFHGKREKYYEEKKDRLKQARNARRIPRKGKSAWKVEKSMQAQLNKSSDFQVQFNSESVASSVTVQAFHTTDEGKLLLDTYLFAPPSPAHYTVEPNTDYSDWQFQGDSFDEVGEKYMDLEEAKAHISKKRKADYDARASSKKQKTDPGGNTMDTGDS
jgi:hypothetical protein